MNNNNKRDFIHWVWFGFFPSQASISILMMMVARSSSSSSIRAIALSIFCTTISAPLALYLYLVYEDDPDQFLSACVSTITQAWLSFAACFTPAILFCLINVVVFALALNSGLYEQLVQLRNSGTDQFHEEQDQVQQQVSSELDAVEMSEFVPGSDLAGNFYPELRFFGEGKLFSLSKRSNEAPICKRRPSAQNNSAKFANGFNKPVVAAKPLNRENMLEFLLAETGEDLNLPKKKPSVTSSDSIDSAVNSKKDGSVTSFISNLTNASSKTSSLDDSGKSLSHVLEGKRVDLKQIPIPTKNHSPLKMTMKKEQAPLISESIRTDAIGMDESKVLDVDKRADDFIDNFYKRIKQQH